MFLRFNIWMAVGFLLAGSLAGGVAEAKPKQSHGERQMERVLEDLPALQVYYVQTKARRVRKTIKENDLIWKWAVDKFNKHPKFFWSNQKPFYGASSALILPKGASDGFLTIDPRGRKGQKTYEELWHDLIIELLNMEIHAKYVNVSHYALSKPLSEEEFVEENMRLQFESFTNSLNVLNDVWTPWLNQGGELVVIEEDIWRTNDPQEFEPWYEKMKKESELPAYYRKYYQDRIGPAVKRMHK